MTSDTAIERDRKILNSMIGKTITAGEIFDMGDVGEDIVANSGMTGVMRSFRPVHEGHADRFENVFELTIDFGGIYLEQNRKNQKPIFKGDMTAEESGRTIGVDHLYLSGPDVEAFEKTGNPYPDMFTIIPGANHEKRTALLEAFEASGEVDYTTFLEEMAYEHLLTQAPAPKM